MLVVGKPLRQLGKTADLGYDGLVKQASKT